MVPDWKGDAKSLNVASSPDVLLEQHVLKRCLDIVLSAALIVFIAPVMLIVAVWIKMSGGGPILFSQKRVGKDGQLFSCLKFRTMVTDAGPRLEEYLSRNEAARIEWTEKQKLSFDPRVTRIGDFLRRSSLDELPQLFNVLVGEMSLVGPRPIQPSECVRYEDRLGHYLSVRPGMTGLWQVKGRSDTTYAERVALDTEYVAHQSLKLDLKILLLTFGVIFSQRGSC
ncbi:MAG: sugar transferase [Hyphomicrobiales bacterium]|nr:MAG: sugar transferase [Hyphomicrobiales bacterium]